MYPVADELRLFLVQQHLRQGPKHFRQFLMGVDISLSLILSGVHILTDDAQHPDNSHHMIDMLVGYKNMVNVVDVNPCPLQSCQDFTAASSVHQKMAFFTG